MQYCLSPRRGIQYNHFISRGKTKTIIQLLDKSLISDNQMTRGRGGGGPRRRGGGGAGAGRGRGNFGQIIIGEELKIAVNLALKNFKENSEETELSLPSSLLSTERAYVHKIAVEMGLQSKSRGKGQAR